MAPSSPSRTTLYDAAVRPSSKIDRLAGAGHRRGRDADPDADAMMDATAPLPADARRLTVDLGQRRYDIVIADGLIARAGTLLRPLLAGRRAIVIADETVAGYYLDPLTGALTEAGIDTASLTVPPGEASKSLAAFGDLMERVLALAPERSTTLVALGGGVVGDLAGFAAATALRGLAFVQIPTTLLAQVDSAVGGKTGINSRYGKNLIGAFHQPRAVLADIATLATLPPRQMRAGYAEIVKYGVLGDPGFFDWLVDHGAALLAGDGALCAEAVARSCAAKAAIVAADEREAGRRALLNLGHTFAHAFEAESGYGDRLLHGEAVAIGMAAALRLSVRLGLCPAADADRLTAHLSAVGLPTGLAGVADDDWTAERLVAHMARDKKVADGRATFILARGIGHAFVTRDVPMDAVAATLREALAA